MIKESYIHHDGILPGGRPYSIVGRPINGSAEQYTPAVTKVGEDAAVVLPQYGVVGVFDGAGGAADIGSASEASLTAADAIDQYFRRRDGDLAEAMQYARAAVAANPAAGLCVGALARITTQSIETVNAGDTAAVLYEPELRAMELIAEQQTNRSSGEPANYLGRLSARIAPPIPDAVATARITPERKTELYIMSDGAAGNWVDNTDIQDYHFEAAHDVYPLLQDALRYDPRFIDNIRRELRGTTGQLLAERQIEDSTSVVEDGQVYSPELIDPDTFTGSGFDWDIWNEIVKPYIDKLHPPRSPLGRHAICQSLIERPVAWTFERDRYPDDATIVMVDL